MRIVFMGTPSFAATILEELSSHHDVISVYTRPDAVRGRGRSLVASPVRELADSLGLSVRTPSSLRDPEEMSLLMHLEPDVICVAAYGAILPKEILDIPRFGCLNVHASLLPRWRGAAPVERAILAGDEQAGVCVMRMEEGLDTGDYCVSRSVDIDDKGVEELTDELANLGARSLLTALEHLTLGKARWRRQDESLVTYADKIAKGELDLDPLEAAVVNARRVQASSAAHPSRCVIAGRSVTVLRARLAESQSVAACGVSEGSLPAGRAAFSSKRLFLGCESGIIEVFTLKPDGKRQMDAQSFAAGLQALRGGTTWGCPDA